MAGFLSKLLLFIPILYFLGCSPPEAEQDDALGSESTDIDRFFGKGSGQDEVAPKTDTLKQAELVDVSIALRESSLVNGLSTTAKGFAHYSDGTKKLITSEADWVVYSESVAELDPGEHLVVRALSSGTTTLGMTYGKFSSTVQLTVIEAELQSLQITPTTVVLGTVQQLRLTGIYSDGSTINLTETTTWSSGNPAIATIDNASGQKGRISPLVVGQVNVSAQYNGQIITESVRINSMPVASLVIEADSEIILSGTSSNLRAMATMTNGVVQDLTASVSWSSDNSAIVSVSNELGSKGKITGSGAGTATITATINGISDETNISVNVDSFTSYEIGPTDVNKVPLGATQSFRLYGIKSDESRQEITADAYWSVSNQFLATISNDVGSEGTLGTVSTGEVTISAQFGTEIITKPVEVVDPSLTSITVSASIGSAVCGLQPIKFSATGVYSDGTEADITSDVTWSVDNGTIGAISNDASTAGEFTSTKTGTVVATASYFVVSLGKTISGSKQVGIAEPALSGYEIQIPDNSVPEGTNFTPKALGRYTCEKDTPEDFSDRVTWASDPDNLTIEEGVVKTIGLGLSNPTVYTLSASYNTYVGEVTFEIRPKELKYITVTLSPTNVNVGSSGTMTVIGTYSDNTSDVMTDISAFPGYSLTFSSEYPSAISINSETGQYTAQSEGFSNLSASVTTPAGATYSAFDGGRARSPCATGTRVGFFCYFRGNLNESCLDVCNNLPSGTYSSATETFIGSPAGTGARCDEVLRFMGMGGLNYDNVPAPDGQGLGCSVAPTSGLDDTIRFVGIDTDATSAHADVERICACRDP